MTKQVRTFSFSCVCVFIFLICVIFCCTCFGHTLYYSIHVSISKYKINKHIFFICNIFFGDAEHFIVIDAVARYIHMHCEHCNVKPWLYFGLL